MRFETLGRRIAAAPRAIVLGLVALTLALTPGAVRVRVAEPAADAPEHALFALTCKSGVWSFECLEAVDDLTRALASAPATVARVDSLTTRQQVAMNGGALRLRPLVAELPATRAELRRLHARALADPGATRGLVAGEWTTLVRAELRSDAAPGDVHALVEVLRAVFERPPEVSLAVVSRAWSERELELGARRDLARLVPATLLALALVASLALASLRAGLLVAALAGAAVTWCAGVSGLLGFDLGTSGAVLASAIAATAAAGALALVCRIRLERGDADAVARALASLGAPLAAAALAGALAFFTLGLAGGATTRALGLGAGGGLAGAGFLALVGLPAGWLALGSGAPVRPAAPRAFEAAVEAGLGRLDAALRAHVTWRSALAGLALVGAAALGAARLQPDAAPGRFWAEGSPVREGAERITRGFGGTERLRVELDSGSAGGALEPRFLEHVLALERALASEPWVGSAASLVDGAVLPAMRALHDGDPEFAVVPATRAQVEDALEPFAREAPDRLADGIDAERRALSLELWVDPRDPRVLAELGARLSALALEHLGRRDAATVHGHALLAADAAERLRRGALLGALAACLALGALAGAALGSARAGLLASAPSALAALFAFGALGQLGLPLDSLSAGLGALAALAGGAPALLYLGRVRELCAAGAEPGVAVSVALRDAGRPIAAAALAGLAFLGLLASGFPPVRWFGALACAGVLAATALVLVLTPALARRFPV